MKNTFTSLLLVFLVFTLAACSTGLVPESGSTTGVETGATAGAGTDLDGTPNPLAVEYDAGDLESGASSSDMTYIWLQGNSVSVEGSGVTVEGNSIAITAAGTYNISGTLNDGQIVVNTEDEQKVVLVLDNAVITCTTSAPIYIIRAQKTVITLADGSENILTDGKSYTLADAALGEPSAAIFSNDDLTINGSGSLVVNANYNHGIASDDNLKITGGHITVNAVNDGLKGKNFIAIKDGVITINAGGDGLQSDNVEDEQKGYIAIQGGTLNITAGLDGIQAETRLAVSGGTITVSSGGGSVNSSNQGTWGQWGLGNPLGDTDSAPSAKGLKAGVEVVITGGTITVDSSDDAIHSNAAITLDGGNILIASGDDGVHSDSVLTINGGSLRITKSYEGIESAAIVINGGTLHLVSSDDGINAAGGADGSSLGGRPGQGGFELSGNYHLTINGGYIYVDAGGDGIDINGTITMTEGLVIVNGPTENMNAALDYLGTFNISGGFLVAVGSSGMAQAPSQTSTQYSVLYNFQNMLAGGTIVHVETGGGEDILTFVPTKAFQSIVISSPVLKNGVTCSIYTGGSSTGAATDGLYSGGTYSAGNQVASFSISGVVTGAGSMGGGFPGGGGGRPRP